MSEKKSNPTDQAKKKFYYGRADNQRDPQAILVNKKASKGRSERKVPSDLPKDLPPPTKLHQAPPLPSAVSPANDSIFASNLCVQENTSRRTFNVSTPALIEISRQTYVELKTDDPSLAETLLPEYLDYYSVAMLWFRIISLKAKNSQPLSDREQEVLTLIQTAPFCVPEPILLQLKALGNVVAHTGIHLYPEFPTLPTALLENLGGYYGSLDDPAQAGVPQPIQLHNLYEEIPCMGVVAAAVRATISDVPLGAYPSAVTRNGQQPSANLFGFKPLILRCEEAKQLARNHGFTPDFQPEYPSRTGINFPFLAAISDILAGTNTFKNTDVVFSTMSDSGSLAQTVIERPYVAVDVHTPAILGEINTTLLAKETPSIFGMGTFFCCQLLKERTGNNDDSWSLFPEIPVGWRNNRNVRRNLPNEYMNIRFTVTPEMAASFRTNVIKTLVKEKR